MKLNYKRIGAGQPIVILHGLFGTLDNWYGIGKYFSEKYDVIMVDQRNHGLSPHSDEWSYEVMSNDLEELLTDLDIVPPIIIGHSMGGKTAMKFACSHPELLKALIVVDIAPKYYPKHHGSIIEGLKALDLETISSRTEASELLSNKIEEEGVRQFLLKNLKREDSGKYSWKMNLEVIENKIEIVGEALDTKDVYTGPTKFIRGGDSDYILDSDFDLIQHHFSNSEVATVTDAGHWVHAEQPQKFGLELIKFLESV